nr:MAG TPA_asm: hypothetical protein [Caudoviricetes sp.]
MTLIYLPITSTKATPQVNAYRTINVQLPPAGIKDIICNIVMLDI